GRKSLVPLGRLVSILLHLVNLSKIFFDTKRAPSHWDGKPFPRCHPNWIKYLSHFYRLTKCWELSLTVIIYRLSVRTDSLGNKRTVFWLLVELFFSILTDCVYFVNFSLDNFLDSFVIQNQISGVEISV